MAYAALVARGLVELVLHHVLLGNEVQILHEALALVVLWLLCQLNGFGVGAFVLLWHAADLLHVLALVLILHELPLLTFLAARGLLLLEQEVLVLLRGWEVLVPDVQVHALESLVIQLVDLLVDVLGLLQRYLRVVAARYALDSGWVATIFLGQVDAVRAHR